MSLSNYAEDKVADAFCNNVALAVAQLYIKLHTGNPGEDCTANPAVETTRKAVSFGASAGGVCTSDVDVVWTNVAATETFSHGSYWDAPTGGNAIGYGPLGSPKAVNITDTFTIQATGATLGLD